MSMASDCGSFQAHAWKRETCANCMKSKASHKSTNVKSPTSPKHITSTITSKKSAGKATSDTTTASKKAAAGKTDHVTSPRRTYNYGGYRSTMKRDNDSTDSQLSLKSNASDKSSKSTRSGISSSTRTTKVANKRDSKDNVLSNNDKSPGGEKNVEQALKTLTSAARASPKVGRKGSRTTMNYGTSLNNNNNSANTSPTESGSSVTSSGASVNKQTGNNLTSSSAGSVQGSSVTKHSSNHSSWLHSGNTAANNVTNNTSSVSSTSSSRPNIPLDKNVGKLSSVLNPQKASITITTNNNKTSQQANQNISNVSSGKADQNINTSKAGSASGGNSNVVISKESGKKSESKPANINNKNTTAHKVEKRQVLIDKGKYSTEKIIFDKSTVITSPTREILPKGKTSSKRSSKEELSNITSSKTQASASSQSKTKSFFGKDNVKTSAISQRSSAQGIVGNNKDQGKRKSSSEMVNIEKQVNSSSKKPANVKPTTISDSKPVSKQKSSENLSDDPEYKSGAKVTRKRSKSRPPGPPPCVPPMGNKCSPRRAMIDSYHSDMSESQSNDSQLSQQGAYAAGTVAEDSGKKGGGDDSFGDLYNDILNTLSEVKDITPDLLNTLKGEGKAKKEKHYYHKYDLGIKPTSPEKGESLTISSALACDGSSSIIIETMNTSFHAGSGEGEVEDISAQTLAMPYNIVDVSKIVPRGKSPRLPSTPAPESRNTTLNRSTLNKKKGSTCSASSTGSNSPVIRDRNARNSGIIINQADGISLDGKVGVDSDVDESLQGLHPRYWHTYEPIDISAEAEQQRNKQPRPSSTNKNKTTCDSQRSSMPATDKSDNNKIRDPDKEAFIRRTAARATAPVRGNKNGSDLTNVDTNSGSLAHLDLEANSSKGSSSISKSAEDLLEDMTDSLGEPKKRKNSIKKKNSNGSSGGGGGGFFRRLFGLGRKSSTDLDQDAECNENGDSSETGQFMSIQENAEFFKPLKVDTNLSPDDKDVFKTASPSPTKSTQLVGSPNLVSEIENAMFERKLTPKDLKLIIPNGDTSQKTSDSKNQNMDTAASSKKVPASPIEPYGTSKDFVFIRNEKDISSTKSSTTAKPSPPPIPTTNPRASALINKPTLSPKPSKIVNSQSDISSHSTNRTIRNAKTVSISDSPEHSGGDNTIRYNKSSSNASLVSPGSTGIIDSSAKVSGSTSQTSLLSDGSSDCRSISSREEQGSSGDSSYLGRKQRPKSQAVSRKMLEAPPPPPPGSEKRRSAEVSPPPSGAGPGTVSPKSPKTSPTSPTKLLMTNPLAKLAQKGKSKRHSVSEDTYDTCKKVPSSPKKLEISGPIELQSSTFNSSQTLPRPLKKPMATTPVKESQDDLAATGRRKMDSVAKHARNKTVTEGVKFDVSMLNNDGENNRLAELLDRKTTSKFVNRALPPTPAESSSNGSDTQAPSNSQPTHQKTASGDYEWVNTEGIQLARKSKKKDRSLYEEADEDIYTDPIEHSDDMALNGTTRKTPLKSQMSLPGRLTASSGPSLKAPPSAFTDYLQPNDAAKLKPLVALKPVMYGDEKGTLVKNQLSLGPKPRNIQPLQMNGDKNPETYVSMIYQNTEMIIDKTRPPLDVGEGFRRMAFINVETLLHVANSTVTNYLQQDAKIDDSLKFSHFILLSMQPYVHQGCVSYYNARTYKFKPNECMLMISAKYINPDLLHHTCVHLLQPSLIFSDRILATYFPDNGKSSHSSSVSTAANSSKVYQHGGMVQTNMAVITYHSIQTLQDYVKEELQKKASNGETFERTVCYLLYQVLSSVLSSHDGTSVYVIKTVKVADVLVVTHPSAKDEQYLVINPLSSGEIEVMEDEVLCSDIIALLCQFLDISTDTAVSHSKITADNMHSNINHLKNLSTEVLRKIQGKSKYMLGLKKLVEVLKGGTISSILVARSVLEYTLWGPTDKEIKSLLLATEREQAFCIWLEVTRCKGVNELALGQLVKNLELAHMFHFLCTVTGSTMLDVTKLLYKHK